MTSSWRPLLDGAAAKEALEAVDGIADAIWKSARARSRKRSTSRKRAHRDASLAGGAAGLAVFFAYLGEGRNGRYKAEASRLLEESADALASRRMDASLYGGF